MCIRDSLTAVCGVSGSGKTTMILESLVSGLQAQLVEKPLPDHVKTLRADGIRHVKLIDATPIGINVRSTVATYAGAVSYTHLEKERLSHWAYLWSFGRPNSRDSVPHSLQKNWLPEGLSWVTTN